MKIKILILSVVGLLIVLICIFLIVETHKVRIGKGTVIEQLRQMQYKKLTDIGTVRQLSILPLIDSDTDDDQLVTENGVAYLIQADGLRILFDVGLNAKQKHPSPLLQNMANLGVRPSDIDLIMISHLHMDHIGGLNDQRKKTFSLSQGTVEIRQIPVYAPASIKSSVFHPQPQVRVVYEPARIAKGIASIGIIPRHLFLAGYIAEQCLAINVDRKGLVLIIGCGHPTIERIIERTRMLFDIPIYAIIGGLHYPIPKKGEKTPWRLFQYTLASDSPPWQGLKDDDVHNAINAIKQIKPYIVSLSPHDSTPWSIQQFRDAFKEKYAELKVGRTIKI